MYHFDLRCLKLVFISHDLHHAPAIRLGVIERQLLAKTETDDGLFVSFPHFLWNFSGRDCHASSSD